MNDRTAAILIEVLADVLSARVDDAEFTNALRTELAQRGCFFRLGRTLPVEDKP